MFAPVPHCRIFYVQGKPPYRRQFICRVHIKERDITRNLDSRKHGITGVRVHYLSKTLLLQMFNVEQPIEQNVPSLLLILHPFELRSSDIRQGPALVRSILNMFERRSLSHLARTLQLFKRSVGEDSAPPIIYVQLHGVMPAQRIPSFFHNRDSKVHEMILLDLSFTDHGPSHLSNV